MEGRQGRNGLAPVLRARNPCYSLGAKGKGGAADARIPRLTSRATNRPGMSGFHTATI